MMHSQHRPGGLSPLTSLARKVRPLPLLLIVTTGLTSVGMIVGGPVAPCSAQGKAPPITPAQRAAALAGAQGLVGRMARPRSLAGMADLLTNRSAGDMGVMLTGLMGIGLSDAIPGSRSPGGHSPSGLTSAHVGSDYGALLKRWGLSEKGAMRAGGTPPGALPPAVAGNGRRFLADVTALMERISPGKGRPPGAMGGVSARDVTYTVLSPTRVRLTVPPRLGQQPMPPVEAVQEEGQWRLDLGDVRNMLRRAPGPATMPSSPTVMPPR